jgi:hypothetical protein
VRPAVRTVSLALLSLLSVAAVLDGQTRPEIRNPSTSPGAKGTFGNHIVATAEIAAELAAGAATRQRVTGRVSLHLISTPETLAKNQVVIRAFNVALFGVPQAALSEGTKGRRAPGSARVRHRFRKAQTLRYDEKGSSPGAQHVRDASFLNAFTEPIGDARDDLFQTPVVPATAAVRIDFEGPLPRTTEALSRLSATLDLQIRAPATKYRGAAVSAIDLRLAERVKFPVQIAVFPWFEVAKRLCVQPVRILQLDWFSTWFGVLFPIIQLSGDGLPFGEPGARTQWAKADVVFEIRDWKTIWAPDQWVLDSSEAAGLRGMVDDDDCIEVFFRPRPLSVEPLGRRRHLGLGNRQRQDHLERRQRARRHRPDPSGPRARPRAGPEASGRPSDGFGASREQRNADVPERLPPRQPENQQSGERG